MNYLEIKTKCSNCGEQNQALLAPAEQNSVHCEACNACIVEVKAIQGFVYVLSNAAFPTYLKVGYSERNVKDRVQELNSATGLPRPFVLEAYYYSAEPRVDEQRIHSELEDYRVSENREFFELDIESAIKKISGLLNKTPYYQENRLLDLQKLREKENEDSKYLTITCGHCFSKIPVEKTKGVIEIECPQCPRVIRVRT